MGGGGGGQSGAQHVPMLSLPKCGPAKLVSKRSTGCLRGLVEDDSHGIVLHPFNSVGKSLTTFKCLQIRKLNFVLLFQYSALHHTYTV